MNNTELLEALERTMLASVERQFGVAMGEVRELSELFLAMWAVAGRRVKLNDPDFDQLTQLVSPSLTTHASPSDAATALADEMRTMIAKGDRGRREELERCYLRPILNTHVVCVATAALNVAKANQILYSGYNLSADLDGIVEDRRPTLMRSLVVPRFEWAQLLERDGQLEHQY